MSGAGTAAPDPRPADRAARRYRVFGGHLASELPFPELPAGAGSPPDWTLRFADRLPPEPAARCLGRIEGRIGMSLHRSAAGYRYRCDDTGEFEMDAAGRALRWAPAAGADERLARLDVLNRVLPLALHAGGALCLHGSGVVLPAGAVCFLAPKYHGKSTLAMALSAFGAALLSDDTLAIEPGRRHPLVRPGPRAVRLWPDSAARLGAAAGGEGAEGKRVVQPSASPAADAAAPLAAVYLLAPRPPRSAAPPAERTRLEPVVATMALVGQSRLGTLFDGVENARVLERAAGLTERVAVYRLELDREFDRLEAAAQRIAGWHAGAGAATAAPS